MTSRFLLPHWYKKIGWILFIPSVIIAITVFITGYEWPALDWEVPTFAEKESIGLL